MSNKFIHIVYIYIYLYFQCNVCNQDFSTQHNMKRHQKKTCIRRVDTSETGDNNLKTRVNKQDSIEGGSSASETSLSSIQKHILKFKCKFCASRFATRKEQYEHLHLNCLAANIHNDLQAEPFSRPPWLTEAGEIIPKFQRIYNVNRKIILSCHSRLDKIDSLFNFPVDHLPTNKIISEHVNSIFELKQHSFKINLSFGYILKHVESAEYRYYKPAANNSVFDFPLTITDRKSLQNVVEKLKEVDITNYLQKNRENTKWKVVYVTNVFYQTFTLNFALGQSNILPKHIINHRFILGLSVNPKSKKPYKDNMCIFRCLVTHKKCLDTEKEVLNHFKKWNEYCVQNLELNNDKKKFLGFPMNRLAYFEDCFQIRVNVYNLKEDGDVIPIYISNTKFEDSLYLNLYENHLSYITDFRYYAHKFICINCNRHFTKPAYLKKHYRVCSKIKKN